MKIFPFIEIAVKCYAFITAGACSFSGFNVIANSSTESVSKTIVISQLKKSERGSLKKKSILKMIMQSVVINFKPVRAPALGPQQIIHNQDMWFEAANGG
ncbi:hypothetical protein SADUNF_Sadunf16G0056100 [Salix dunnii]|uniref:Uncharacterized protein n=1 Tax=Salix dunnii TaxID=1413687 RepID=A0A835MIC5_9ROSI|nr:hypothetical protein SADUNF_Sadunf16G0056100 [Salix dunnii]